MQLGAPLYLSTRRKNWCAAPHGQHVMFYRPCVLTSLSASRRRKSSALLQRCRFLLPRLFCLLPWQTRSHRLREVSQQLSSRRAAV